jgi:hypothetical protein
MADKKIKVQVDVQTDVEPSIAALKALKKQLRDTAAGSEEFIALQQQIDDVQDSLVSARAGAGNFADVLGGLPGPIGAIGGQASGLITSLKQFGQLKFANVQASFVELGRDLSDVASGFLQLTGITKVYTVTNNALAKSFVAVGVGEQAAAVGAKALSAALVATGIGALVVLLGAAASALYELATGTKAAEAATKSLNSALESQNRILDLNQKATANRQKVTIAQMKAAGKSETDIRKYQIDQSFKDYEAAYEAEVEARKIYNKNIKKADEAGAKALGDNLAKREQATKDARATYLETGYTAKAEELKAEEAANKELAGKQKQASDARLADRKKELDELRKGLDDARLTTLSERDKELSIVKTKYDELRAKAIKFGEDTKVIEQARAKENSTITEKYAKEELEKKQQQYSDTLVLEEQQLNLRLAKGQIDETQYQNSIFELRKNAAVQTEILKNEELAKDDAALQLALEKNKEYVAAQIDLEKYNTEQKKVSAEEQRGILLSTLQSKFETLDAENQRLDLDFEADLVRLGEQREILAEQEAIDLANEDLTEFQRTEIRKKYADARKDITNQEVETEKAAAAAKHEINMAYLGLFEQFGNLLGQIAGKNKGLAIAGIVISQASAIGQIIANTAIANAKSVAASPLTAGQPWVAINTISAGLSIASTIASAAKSISQINSQPGASGGGGSAGGAGSSAQMPKPPTVSGAAAPQVQTSGGMNPNTQIAQTIGAASKPVRAYVVAGDVSSQQALDRRTTRAATFSAD